MDYEITEEDAMTDGWWNHRLYIEYVVDEPWYTIRETFYDGNGRIWGCSEDADGVCGETPEEVRQSLEWMLEALGKPVVRLDSIPEEGARNPVDALEGVDLSTATTLEELERELEERDEQ